jgi:hypothetical protein
MKPRLRSREPSRDLCFEILNGENTFMAERPESLIRGGKLRATPAPGPAPRRTDPKGRSAAHH